MRKLTVLPAIFVFFIACKNNQKVNNPEKDDYGTANKTGWAKNDKNKFMNECVESFIKENQEALGDKICPCVLEKMEKEYASYNEADTKEGKSESDKLALQCYSEISGNPDNTGNNNQSMDTRSSIVGNWGDLTVSKINYYDPTGNMIGSGLSHGAGYGFNADGSYAQTFLATSSHPDYKIFIYTTGKYTVSGSRVDLFPADKYYRKWEDETLVTDEHSRSAAETFQWAVRSNKYTGKRCLYLLRSGENQEIEFCEE